MDNFNLSDLLAKLEGAGLAGNFDELRKCLDALDPGGNLTEPAGALLKGLDGNGAGFKREAIFTMLGQLTTGLDTGTRKTMLEMIRDLGGRLGCGEMPVDLAGFLDRWQQGEE